MASHDGRIYIHSTCNLEITLGPYSTYYAHINVKPGLKNNMMVKAGDIIGRIEIKSDKALCLCNWDEASYSCSTGPHLHWEVRKDGQPVSLNNMIVGGIKIRTGKYERDASCTDPEHCLLARDTFNSPCATYFIDQDNTIYCPSVRGNTGMFDFRCFKRSSDFNITMLTMYCSNLNSIIMIGGNFNYGRDPGWKLPGRPIMNPGGTTKGIIIVHIFTTYTNQSVYNH